MTEWLLFHCEIRSDFCRSSHRWREKISSCSFQFRWVSSPFSFLPFSFLLYFLTLPLSLFLSLCFHLILCLFLADLNGSFWLSGCIYLYFALSFFLFLTFYLSLSLSFPLFLLTSSLHFSSIFFYYIQSCRKQVIDRTSKIKDKGMWKKAMQTGQGKGKIRKIMKHIRENIEI